MNADDSSTNYGTYVYCIGWSESLTRGGALRSTPLGGEGGARLVEFNDLAAVVSDSRERRYAASRRHLLAHEHMIEEALERSDVLPMRLGLVADDDETLKEVLLNRQYSVLKRELERVHNRVELGLKVSWEEPRLFREIFDEYPDLRADIATESFDERLRRGEFVAQAKAEKGQWEAEAILTELRPLAAEAVENQRVSEMMLLNAAFLVERGRVSEFDERVGELGKQQRGRLVFSYVGPLPPYNFVDTSFTLESEREAEGESLEDADLVGTVDGTDNQKGES